MNSALLELVHLTMGISTVAILNKMVRIHLPGSIENFPTTAYEPDPAGFGVRRERLLSGNAAIPTKSTPQAGCDVLHISSESFQKVSVQMARIIGLPSVKGSSGVIARPALPLLSATMRPLRDARVASNICCPGARLILLHRRYDLLRRITLTPHLTSSLWMQGLSEISQNVNQFTRRSSPRRPLSSFRDTRMSTHFNM
jgi:hypothetical protein